MDIFGDKKSKQIEYLEEERKKLWQRITALENEDKRLQTEINKKATDAEKEAAQSSRKAAEYRNKTEQRATEANDFVVTIQAKVDEAERLLASIGEKNDKATELKTILETNEEGYKLSYDELILKVNTLNSFLEDYPDLDSKLTVISDFVSGVEDNLGKSKLSLTALNKTKKEIDDFHRDIFGYIDKDDAGDEIVIEGKKSDLDEAYEDLHEKLEQANNRITTITDSYKKKYDEFEISHKSNYEKINNEIESLLPAALTAGLSSAFSTKKGEEAENSQQLQSRFSMGIYMLIVVSLLPFAVSVYFLYTGTALEEVISKIPRLVLAIIPMYIPVLWFTYSANKKLNLSKRLIEEYAHKEVLSKTYEGLSKQIANLEDEEQTSELKYRLLSSFLQVTSENPGKLISNYEASDHPVMEALEQSYKFQLAIDKLEGIPGMGKVAAILESSSKRKLKEKQEIIDRALGANEEEEEEEEEA
ncbi:hypothetical protein [Planobacterium oryzisoli]|uniref:Uncharacterized protein n=1 Tax=Planobacterium oryzisoli TaxID=2771435 RepID=A0A931E6F3_9FLAO|nr:hypothetical protein [Planobacterium oryzisoli]MBF5027575.1 hypothetical protein [Planobacterium oryzisoli]